MGATLSPCAWELKDPKLLESDQIKLLMEDYTNLGNGRMQIHPCTILFTPEGPDDPTDRNHRTIVLQAPEGAILQFDNAFNLSKLKVGRFLGGTMAGPVIIRSAGRQPNGQDALLVKTSNVQMGEYDILDARTGRFPLGPALWLRPANAHASLAARGRRPRQSTRLERRRPGIGGNVHGRAAASPT